MAGVEKIVGLADDVVPLVAGHKSQPPGVNGFVPAPNAVDKVVDTFDRGFSMASMAAMPLMLLGGLGGFLASKAGFLGKAGRTLQKPNEYKLHRLGIGSEHSPLGQASVLQGMFDASILVGTGAASYHIARSFSDKWESLRQLAADMTGKDARKISDMDLALGSVPKAVAEARSHLFTEHGLRGLTQVFAMTVGLRGLMKEGSIPILKGFMAPQIANVGIDMFIAESPVLNVYKGISDAYKAHKPLSGRDYATFVLAASDKLRGRGKVGEAFAQEVGKQYAAEHKSPWEILNEVGKGVLNQRVEKIKAEHAPQRKAVSQAPAAGKGEWAQRQFNPLAGRAVVGDGKYTGLLHQEAPDAQTQGRVV